MAKGEKVSATPSELSRITDSDSIMTISGLKSGINADHASRLLNLLGSRILTLKANINMKKDRRQFNQTRTLLDITHVNDDCKVKLDDHWMAINNAHIKTKSLTVMLFDYVAYSLMSKYVHNSQRLSISTIEDLPHNIIPVAVSFANSSETNGDLIQALQHESLKNFQTQDELVEIASSVAEKIDEKASQTHEAKMQRIKKRVVKTKCARAIINCILDMSLSVNSSNEDYEKFFEYRMKYRCPPQV